MYSSGAHWAGLRPVRRRSEDAAAPGIGCRLLLRLTTQAARATPRRASRTRQRDRTRKLPQRCCACPGGSPVSAGGDQVAKAGWGDATGSSCAVRGCSGAAAFGRGGLGGNACRRRQRPEACRGVAIGELTLEDEKSERRRGVAIIAA